MPRSRIARNNESFGEMRPKRYTTLSADTMTNIQEASITPEAIHTPMAHPYTTDSKVIWFPIKFCPRFVTPNDGTTNK